MAKYKYGRPKRRTINENEIRKYLRGIDFEVEKIFQEWRHLLAFGKFQGKDTVFKLASTQATGTRTENEYYWNEAVNEIENQHPNLVVPKNLSFGYCGKLFYFITEKFPGDAFIKKGSGNVDRIASKIDKVAKITREIETLIFSSQSAFYKKGREKRRPIGYGLLSSATEWASRVPRNLDKFLEVIDKAKDRLRTTPAHGDFTGRHMYKVGKKIGITDGEHAGKAGALHYDVAQFYIRLRNDNNAKKMARDYLAIFKSLLPKEEKGIFWKELKPVLIQRYIGDLWGAANDPRTLDERKSLGEEILKDQII